MKILKGNLNRIAKKVGCSRNYVSLVLGNQLTGNAKKAREIRETATKLLTVLQPEDQESVTATHSSDIATCMKSRISVEENDQREKVLRELNSHFISMISHEFSIPMATILVSADLLDVYSEKMSRSEISQKISRIKKNVFFLKRIIDDVTDFSLIEKGEMKFSPTKQEINSFLNEVIKEYQEIDLHSHFISLKRSGHPLYARIDQSMIRQSIDNLLSNSFKYSKEGSTIDVKLLSRNNNVVIEITDQGIGIPEDEADLIFEPFKRGSNVGSIHGTGLGLTLSRHMVRMHGGEIVLNADKGCSTTFTIILPPLV